MNEKKRKRKEREKERNQNREEAFLIRVSHKVNQVLSGRGRPFCKRAASQASAGVQLQSSLCPERIVTVLNMTFT